MSSQNKSELTSVAGFEIKTRQPPSNVVIHSDSLLNQLYSARGVCMPNELDTDLKGLLPWQSLKGITPAVELLLAARAQQSRVLIVGDYDADGATSTALGMLGLQAMGFDVSYLLPNRFEYGYGLSEAIVELALTHQPDLIITVDNGIASIEGVAKARAHGVDVLVTDHHLPADRLPNANAIVNPNQKECGFQSKAACGCTVMFYVLIALRASLRERGETALPNLGQWLDLVALATVADVVPLDANNRRLVKQGIQRVRSGACREGIKALYEVSGKSLAQAHAQDFGFLIGPRLNAAGRLDDMNIGVALLLTDDAAEARSLASQLHQLNIERRSIEASMLAEISPQMLKGIETPFQHSAVVSGEGWHEGVIGIVAARVKERVHRPTIAFAPSDDGELKGSGRSVPGVHLRDCLDWVTKRDDAIIKKFGGHAMAAGLTIAADKLEKFSELFDASVAHFAQAEALTPHVWVDGELPEHRLTLETAKLLENEGPWGQAFAQPEFVGQWPVIQSRVLKDKHLKLTLKTGSGHVDGIAFNVSDDLLSLKPARIKGVYQLACNRFRDQETLQLMFSKMEAIE